MESYTKILEDIQWQKNKLKENLDTQKHHRRSLACMQIPYNQFKVNGTFDEGNKMFQNVATLALNMFDDKCDKLIKQMRISKYTETLDAIERNYDNVNKYTESFEIYIKPEYYSYKIEQCQIQFQLNLLQTKYKEIEQAERDIIKEQLKEERKLIQEQEKLERRKADLQYKFNKSLEKTGQQDEELKEQIDGLTETINNNGYKLRHKRCGYVYVVSNNDMKEGQYKIGITRRTVEERMKELGSGASHSFPMNVHGYVYCDDCFQVEAALHKHFSAKRVNQVNPKKEWFFSTLDEIQKAFKDVCNIDIELKEVSNESYLYSAERLGI